MDYIKHKKVSLSFNGKFFALTDTHGKTRRVAGLLTEIEQRCSNKSPAFLIDGGDFIDGAYSRKTTGDVFTTFARKNKHIKSIFNIGNLETDEFLNPNKINSLSRYVKKLKKSGIVVISSTLATLKEKVETTLITKFSSNKDDVKPVAANIVNLKKTIFALIDKNKDKEKAAKYVESLKSAVDENKAAEIITNLRRLVNKNKAYKYLGEIRKTIADVPAYTVVEDSGKKILITGTTVASNAQTVTIKDQAKALQAAINSVPTDSVVVVSHNQIGASKEISEHLKVDNLGLIIGGHPHSIHVEKPLIYPPPTGEGVFYIDHTEKGVNLSELAIKAINTYDYSVLGSPKNPPSGVISNNNHLNPIPFKNYSVIMKANQPELEKVAVKKLHADVAYRIYNGISASETSEIGTLMANKLRDKTKADAALFLTMEFRAPLPPKGNKLDLFDIKDTLLVNRNVYVLKNATPEQLVEMFEVSLKNQHEKASNSLFLEFSDNIKIERFVYADGEKSKDKPKIKQIFIKKDNKEIALLDNEQKIREDVKNQCFNIATCEYVAKDKEKSALDMFKTIEKIEQHFDETGKPTKTEEVFIEALNSLKPNSSCKRSEIKNIPV